MLDTLSAWLTGNVDRYLREITEIMKPLFASLFLSALILVGLSGCGSSPPPLVDAGTVSANDTTAASDAAADGGNKTPDESATKRFERDGITAEIATWEETQIIVAQHTGKVVVLDVWSTYCEPCIEEFPNLVALQKQYADQIVCISFNINYVGLEDTPPESNSEEVLDVLVSLKSELHNIISSTSKPISDANGWIITSRKNNQYKRSSFAIPD